MSFTGAFNLPGRNAQPRRLTALKRLYLPSCRGNKTGANEADELVLEKLCPLGKGEAGGSHTGIIIAGR